MAIFLVFGILLVGKNVEVSKASEISNPQNYTLDQSGLSTPPLPILSSSQASYQSLQSESEQSQSNTSEFKRIISGMVEYISYQEIRGYAMNLENPDKPLEVRIYNGKSSYNGGQLVKTFVPDQIREIDSKSGLFGFSFETPIEFQGENSFLFAEIEEGAGYPEVLDTQIIPPVKFLKC